MKDIAYKQNIEVISDLLRRNFSMTQEKYETIMLPILSDGLPRSVICGNNKTDSVYGLIKYKVLLFNNLNTTQVIKHTMQIVYSW